MQIPNKLKTDAITEALLELRFDTELPEELVVGRLLDLQPWVEYEHVRLPLADVPGPIRRSQGAMRFQALYDARGPNRVVKLGSHVISFHVLGKYPGWPIFEGELHSAIDKVFTALKSAQVTRLGLRYINAINRDDHFVSGFDDLTLKIQLRGEKLPGPKNLNFITSNGRDMLCTTRVASKEFMLGTPAKSLDLLVDIDVHTPTGYTVDSASSVNQWVGKAHDFEKKCFFALVEDQTIERLKEDLEP